jgi:hypothetical protein
MLKHMYYCPNTGLGSVFCIERFPKQYKQDIGVDDPEHEAHAWGIELTVERDWWLLSVPAALIVISSLVVGVVWARSKHDVQGGFAIGSYMLALSACLFAMMQVLIDRV